MSRRRFVHHGAAMASTQALPSLVTRFGFNGDLSIVDAHIHLFDPTRPGGVPWPSPTDTVLYRPALPARYSALARPEGVIAAVAVECSPLLSDNDWLLRTAADNEIVVGVIGDLDPADKGFPAQLDRLADNPLFRGIRYGNLWNRDLGAQITNPMFLANLRKLAHHSLVLESANPTPQLVSDLLRITRTIPELRIVIDHLPQALPPEDRAIRSQYLSTLKQLSESPRVFIKGSEILRKVGDSVPLVLSGYKGWLDTLWELFGEDRLFFGSDWPNSDQLTPLNDVFAVARSYLATHSVIAARKFFLNNSVSIYGWKPRNDKQKITAT